MQLISLNVARAEALQIDGREVLSGIRKRSVSGAVAVHTLGLDGDEQADPSVHGGRAKAVYAYPSEHYAFWRTVRAQAEVAGWEAELPWGAMGENLSIAGLQENDAYIGDVLVFPDCELVVSEPRYPCFKFNAVMGFNKASKLMAQSGWCGFYLAVHKEGTIAAGQSFTVRPGPREVAIGELFRAKMRKA